MKNINKKIVLVLSFLIAVQANARENNLVTVLKNIKTMSSVHGDDETEPQNKKTKKIAEIRSFHSVRKWKITIEFVDGEFMSKTISVKENSGRSAMETAFSEAEKYLETIDGIREYNVSPVSNNSFVLLIGGK
ncbi:hypothetical protein [Aquimarina sp. I32.4]|uniref:hypothetical protein n=1 Tax=Aquimarina sp. I32.4 TaxID=2053903 RepID=UPI000CDE63CB|nr:hypothetical protein [Aquimarina sp. I32.4]